MSIKQYFLTSKLLMRIIGVFILFFFLYATTAYFYDTLFSHLKQLKWHGEKLFPLMQAHIASWVMAIVIGVGIFAESGPMIWRKIVNWGQVIDNLFLKIFRNEIYFLDEIEKLLAECQDLRREINVSLQNFMVPEQVPLTAANYENLYEKINDIKSKCLRINYLLNHCQANDALDAFKQKKATAAFTELVETNLQFNQYLIACKNTFIPHAITPMSPRLARK